MIRKPVIRSLGVITLVVGAVIAAVNAGLLDRLSKAGRVHRSLANSSLVAYWVLGCGLVLAWHAWRHSPRRTALAAASLLIAVGAFDLFARVIDLPAGKLQYRCVASEERHHAHAPGRDMVMRLGQGGWASVKTNEDGLRTGYSREEFRKHGTRILVLGDSFAFGLGVRQEDAFPARLEQSLRAAHSPAVAVLNAGIISYSPFLEKILIKEILPHYQPQVVVLLLDATDFADDQRYADAVRPGSNPLRFQVFGPTELDWYGPTVELVRSWFGELLEYPFRIIARRTRRFDYAAFSVRLGEQTTTNTYFPFQHPLEVTRPYLEATLGNIDAVARSATAAGARFVLLVSPRFQHWNPAECADYACPYDRAEPHQFEMFRFFEEVRPSTGWPIIDLLPAFRSAKETPLAFRYDPHWNAEGHAVAARAVAEGLVAGRILE